MKKLFPVLGLLIVFAWGCGKSEKKEETEKAPTTVKEVPTSSKKIVARVNGRPIYEEDLMGRPVKEAIVDEILYDEGLKQGLDKKLEERVERYKRNLIINELKTEIMKSLLKKVDPKEIEGYYKENESRYKYTHVMEVSVEDKNLAEEIHKKALEGKDLEKIASDYANSGKKATVRDLGFSKKYNDIFAGKSIGSVSEVIQQGDRFKIIKLVEVREIPLSRLDQAIRSNILAKKRYEAIDEFAEKLKDKNKIKVEIIEEAK